MIPPSCQRLKVLPVPPRLSAQDLDDNVVMPQFASLRMVQRNRPLSKVTAPGSCVMRTGATSGGVAPPTIFHPRAGADPHTSPPLGILTTPARSKPSVFSTATPGDGGLRFVTMPATASSNSEAACSTTDRSSGNCSPL